MQYLFYIILFSSILGTFATPQVFDQRTPKKKVFLLAGQSNMDGRADGALLSERDVRRLDNISDRIHFYYNHLPVSPLQLTTPPKHIQRKFNLEQCFGPELFFGIELAEAYLKDEFIFIKRAKGGTSLYGCWNPDWSEEKAKAMDELDQPRLFPDFIAYVHEVLQKYDPAEYEIAGMLWVQGETDSSVKKWGEAPADSYGMNLHNLVEQTRDLLGVPQMPFVLFQVGRGKVVEGMRQLAREDDHVYLIPQSPDPGSVHSYERNPPPIGHYTAKSMKRIGNAFFQVFESILNGK